MTEQELNYACEVVRDCANEYFGDWEQSCKLSDDFRKAMSKCGEIAIDKLWHKTSEELPMYDVAVIVSYDTEDCCFNHRSNNPMVKTTENGWCEIGYDAEPTHWMEIPEIKED